MSLNNICLLSYTSDGLNELNFHTVTFKSQQLVFIKIFNMITLFFSKKKVKNKNKKYKF